MTDDLRELEIWASRLPPMTRDQEIRGLAYLYLEMSQRQAARSHGYESQEWTRIRDRKLDLFGVD